MVRVSGMTTRPAGSVCKIGRGPARAGTRVRLNQEEFRLMLPPSKEPLSAPESPAAAAAGGPGQAQAPAGAPSAPTGAGRVRSALGDVLFYISFPFGFMGFILPIYGEAIGASATAIGALFSVFSLMTLVLRPLVGYSLDRWGRRPFFLAGVSLYAATMLIFAAVANYTGLLVARTVQGVASSGMWLAVYAMVSDFSDPQHRGGNYGAMQQRANAGGLYGAILGFLVLMAVQRSLNTPHTALAIQASFALYFAVSLYALAKAVRVPETWRGSHAPAGVDPPSGGAAASAAVAERAGAAGGKRLFSPRYLGVLGAVFLTGTGNGMLAPLMMVYLMAKTGASIVELGLAYLPAGLVWAVLPEKAGQIADRHGRRKFMILGLLASAAVALIVPASAKLWPLAFIWAAEAAALSLAIPAEQATISDLTGENVRGQAYGYYDVASASGFTLGPLLGGWLFDHFSHAAPFYADAAILLLAAVVVAAALRGFSGRNSPSGNE